MISLIMGVSSESVMHLLNNALTTKQKFHPRKKDGYKYFLKIAKNVKLWSINADIIFKIVFIRIYRGG